MKKTLAILLSVIMMLGVMPFATFAADAKYDRNAVASNDETYIDGLDAEAIAAVLLDWVDRQIAAATADFETFEVEVYGQTIALEIPEIKSIDDIMQYANYLTQLEGDFANLTGVAEFAALTRANGDLNFIYGVFDFMAANSDTFGKVFRWDENVFDYGKVGQYILALDTTDATNKKIVDFYNNYLIGNNIQEWFISGVAQEMNYTIPTNADGSRAETFDETISNGIITWFAGLCEKAGILSADGLATLKGYDLRTADIYAHVKNFVALVQEDNQVKIDTYYNFLLDTVVRTLLKTMLAQTAEIGEAVAVPASFTETYKDLALLAEISGGTVNYKDESGYYQITIADGVATAKTLTWVDVLDINMDPPVVNIYTGAGLATPVQTYKPNNENFTIGVYASEKNQTTINTAAPDSGITFTGTEVPAEASAVMIDANAKTLTDGVKIETIINGNTDNLVISFAEIEEYVEEYALMTAQAAAQAVIEQSPFPVDVAVEGVDISIEYKGWATEDDFIAQAYVATPQVTLSGSMASFAQTMVDEAVQKTVDSGLDNPVITVVVDDLTGGKYDLEAIEALMNYIDTDFVIDDSILDIAGNYDAYKGAIGQVNHILVSLVNMLVSDEAEAELALVDSKETRNADLYANLQKIADKSNSVIGMAKEFLSGDEIKAIFDQLNVNDQFASSHGLNLDMILGLDFSDVESMIVCGIEVILDFIDDETAGLVNDIHNAVEGLETLDAMAVALANYAAPKALEKVNTALGTTFTWTATDAKTVADGGAEDVILNEVLAITYDAAVWGVDYVNDAINEMIGHIEGEVNADLPTVAFELGVAEGANWEETLANLTNRVYELADGIIIACDNNYTDTIDKISAVFNAILPTEAMFSNCSKGEFAVDGNTVKGYLFGDALEGDFGGFLGMFEVKEDAIAGDVPVTGALVNACEHIVDAIFPDTIQPELEVYDLTSLTIQEVFTGADSDQAIASGNMKSINAREADLVPAVLNLVREAGVLPYFAKCDKDHTALADSEKTIVPEVPANCTTAGVKEIVKCAECGYVVSGGEVINALGHDYIVDEVKATCTSAGSKTTTCSRCDYKNVETLPQLAHTYGAWNQTKAPTCTSKGTEARSCSCGATQTREVAMLAHSYGAWKVTKAATCEENGTQVRTCACGKTETKSIAKIDHVDDNDDNECDICGDEIDSGFFAKIKAFFQKIINWFKNLFN